MLDKDGNGYLDAAEYKELRRLAKKAVRPKKCARTFARTCDLNRDLKLSRQEWGACLANDFTRKLYTYRIFFLKRMTTLYSVQRENVHRIRRKFIRSGKFVSPFTVYLTYQCLK